MPELQTFRLKCKKCEDLFEIDATETEAQEFEAEDGAFIECLKCKVESEYDFADFKLLAEADDEDDEDDDTDDIEDLDDDDTDDDDEPTE